jgi:hypothetical protein
VPKGAESPLDVLIPAHGDDAAAERFWERLRVEASTPRMLGEANGSARPMRSSRAASFFRSPACSRPRPRPPPSSRPRAGSRGSTAACRARAACWRRRACPPRSSSWRARRRCARGSRRSRRASPSALRRPQRIERCRSSRSSARAPQQGCAPSCPFLLDMYVRWMRMKRRPRSTSWCVCVFIWQSSGPTDRSGNIDVIIILYTQDTHMLNAPLRVVKIYRAVYDLICKQFIMF